MDLSASLSRLTLLDQFSEMDEVIEYYHKSE
jgi:hypothetical protein